MKNQKVYIPLIWDLRQDADICLANLTASMGDAFTEEKKAEKWIVDTLIEVRKNHSINNIYVWPEKDCQGRKCIMGFTLLKGIHYFIFTVTIK